MANVHPENWKRHLNSALLAAVSCTVLGAKLITISTLGSSVPIMDQWDAEAARLYSHYLAGTLSAADLFAAHNEHRIFMQRILALLHLELAGEWNPRLQMVLQAFVHTAAVTFLAANLLPLVAVRHRIILAGLVALLFAIPFGYENTLWGFQGQLYCMLLFGITAIVAFAAARPFSLRWFGGLSAAILSFFSFATGATTMLCAGGLVALQLATNVRKRGGREYAGVAVIVSIALAMFLWTASVSHPMSTPLTFIQGLVSLTARVLVAAVPLVWFARYTVTRRPVVSDRSWALVGLSVWIALQLVLLAYGRGTLIAVRYNDIILLAYPVGLVAMLRLVDHTMGKDLRRFSTPKVAVTWVFGVVTVIALMGYVAILGAIDWNKSTRQQVVNVHTYFATHSLEQLRARGKHGGTFDLAYPNSRRQGEVLSDPNVRAILPPEIRPADADNAGARKRMVLNGAVAGITASALRVVLVGGPVLLALGVAAFFAVGTRAGCSYSRVYPRQSPNTG
ncbi:hypothetical protein [Mycobacterium sp. 23]|uniref:hypothetical protein n=1 Tax=Mycobacterium sp. 23 TaxID=3400424 RepID=UPI003AACDAAC